MCLSRKQCRCAVQCSQPTKGQDFTPQLSGSHHCSHTLCGPDPLPRNLRFPQLITSLFLKAKKDKEGGGPETEQKLLWAEYTLLQQLLVSFIFTINFTSSECRNPFCQGILIQIYWGGSMVVVPKVSGCILQAGLEFTNWPQVYETPSVLLCKVQINMFVYCLPLF